MKKIYSSIAIVALTSLLACAGACDNKPTQTTNETNNTLAYTLIDGKEEYRVSGVGTLNGNATIAIPTTYKGKPVTEIGANAFRGNTEIAKVTIPNGIRAIGNGAFEGCTALENVTIPASVTEIGERAFVYCTSITELTVDQANTAYQSIDGNLYSKDGSELLQYALGDTATSYTTPDTVTTIAKGACSKAGNLTTVIMGTSVITVNDYAFMGCTKLDNLTIGNNVQEIGTSAFSSCSALTFVFIPRSVTKMSNNVFYDTDNIYGMSNVKIYCEIAEHEKPSGWQSAWNYCFPTHLPVEWEYTPDEE